MRQLFKVFAILAMIAMLLPVFSGYVLAFVALVSQLLPAWRRFPREATHKESPLHVWTMPIALLLVLLTLPALVSALNEPSDNIKEAVRFWGNNVVKYGFLWFFLRGFVTRGVQNFRFAETVAIALGPILVLHFLYCLCQRYWGIDWAHGLAGQLPQNRFAYGVYRVSGFGSHPLTLGYQLCFITILSIALGLEKTLSTRLRQSAIIGAIFACLTILISGSRGPMLVVIVGIAIMFSRRIRRPWYLYLAGAGIGMLIAAFYLGLLNRFTEILNPNSGDSRLMDWKVYWTAFLDSPILGVGPAGFRSAISAYYSRLGGDATIGLAHNMFLQVAAETGLVGLTGYVVWILTWPTFSFGLARRQNRDVFWALVSVMILSAMTQNSLRDSGVVYTLTMVTMVLGNLFTRVDIKGSDFNDRNSRENES